MLNIGLLLILFLTPLQVPAASITTSDVIQWLIILGGLVWNLLIASNKKISTTTDERIKKIEEEVEKLSQNSLVDGDLTRLKEDIKKALDDLDKMKENSGLYRLSMSERFAQQEKEITQKLNDLNNMLNRALKS